MSGALTTARARIRRAPVMNAGYRVLIAVLGAAIVVVGILLVPLPGPGWVIVFGGLGLWATEFAWAARLAKYGRRVLSRWTAWLREQSGASKVAFAVAAVALLAGLFWVTLAVGGVPGWVPSRVADALDRIPGIAVSGS